MDINSLNSRKETTILLPLDSNVLYILIKEKNIQLSTKEIIVWITNNINNFNNNSEKQKK